MEAARRAGSTVINVRRVADASRAELSITLYTLAGNAFISVKYPYPPSDSKVKTKICGPHLLPSNFVSDFRQ